MSVKAFPLQNEAMLVSEWQQIFKSLYKGVAEGLEVTADGSGLRVFVSAGEGGVAGQGVKVVGTEELTVEATSSPRTGRVVLDPAEPHLKVIYSTPSSTQYQLATIAVGANAVTIVQGDITATAKSVADELKAWLAISGADITGGVNASQITGTLPVNRGGTGGATVSAARAGLRIFVGESNWPPVGQRQVNDLLLKDR